MAVVPEANAGGAFEAMLSRETIRMPLDQEAREEIQDIVRDAMAGLPGVQAAASTPTASGPAMEAAVSKALGPFVTRMEAAASTTEVLAAGSQVRQILGETELTGPALESAFRMIDLRAADLGAATSEAVQFIQNVQNEAAGNPEKPKGEGSEGTPAHEGKLGAASAEAMFGPLVKKTDKDKDGDG